MTRTLMHGGRVLTGGPFPSADAVLVDGDRVLAVGPAAAAAPADRRLDLAGRLVTPALVDAHAHLAATGLAAMGADLSATRSAVEALDLLAPYADAPGGGGAPVAAGHLYRTYDAGGLL